MLQLLVSLAAIIGAPMAIVSLVLGVSRGRRAEKSDRADRMQTRYTEGVTEGRRQMEVELDLLRARLGDAFQDRDVARAQAAEAWRRYNDLLEERRR